MQIARNFRAILCYSKKFYYSCIIITTHYIIHAKTVTFLSRGNDPS